MEYLDGIFLECTLQFPKTQLSVPHLPYISDQTTVQFLIVSWKFYFQRNYISLNVDSLGMVNAKLKYIKQDDVLNAIKMCKYRCPNTNSVNRLKVCFKLINALRRINKLNEQFYFTDESYSSTRYGLIIFNIKVNIKQKSKD